MDNPRAVITPVSFRNAGLTCTNANVRIGQARLSARPRERAPSLAIGVAGGGSVRGDGLRATPPVDKIREAVKVTSGQPQRRDDDSTQRLKCARCDRWFRPRVDTRNETCWQCLLLAVTRERFQPVPAGKRDPAHRFPGFVSDPPAIEPYP